MYVIQNRIVTIKRKKKKCRPSYGFKISSLYYSPNKRNAPLIHVLLKKKNKSEMFYKENKSKTDGI